MTKTSPQATGDRCMAAAVSILPWENHCLLPTTTRRAHRHHFAQEASTQASSKTTNHASGPGMLVDPTKGSSSPSTWQSWEEAPGHCSTLHPTNTLLQVPRDRISSRQSLQESPKHSSSPCSHQLVFASTSTVQNQTICGFAGQSHLKVLLIAARAGKAFTLPHQLCHGMAWLDGGGARDGTPQPAPLSKGPQ